MKLACADPEAKIFYAKGEMAFQEYKEPFVITEPIDLHVYAQDEDQKSAVITTSFYKKDPHLSIRLSTAYANQYNAGGDEALIDGILGTRDFRTGTWQGYRNTDVIATIDLGSMKAIQSIETNFLQDQRSWIFLPKEVVLYTSTDGIRFTKLASEQFPTATASEEVHIKNLRFPCNQTARYVKVVAKTLGALPSWHLGYEHNGRSWVFIDEIIIK